MYHLNYDLEDEAEAAPSRAERPKFLPLAKASPCCAPLGLRLVGHAS